MNIGQINIRSLNKKEEEVIVAMKEFDLDILCIQETWGRGPIKLDNKHNVLYQNRADGYGGIAIIIKKKLTAKTIQINNIKSIEVMGVEI